jgi:hypothetical protein
MAALLEVLDCDGSGRVAYEGELLEFLEAFQLPWHKLVDDVAAKLARHLLRGGAQGWKRFSTLRSRLYAADKTKAGEVPFKHFKEVLAALDVGLNAHEVGRLAEALEVLEPTGGKGGALVQYRELLRFLLEEKSDAFQEAVEGFTALLARQLADEDGGLKGGVQRILDACLEEDALERTGEWGQQDRH